MKHDFYITYADLPLSPAPRAWVEVDASAIRHNYRTVAAAIAKKRPSCSIIAVIKGDAYGHGITECTRIFLSEAPKSQVRMMPPQAAISSFTRSYKW